MSRRFGIPSYRTVEMTEAGHKRIRQLWQKRSRRTPATAETAGSPPIDRDKFLDRLAQLIFALNLRGQRMHMSMLVLTTGLVFVTYVALVFGQANFLLASQPAPDLGNCGDRPCFRGLIPSGTAWNAALAQFNGDSQILDDADYNEIVLLPTTDNTTLTSIFLEIPSDQTLPLAALLSLYGPPRCIEIYRSHDVVMLHYPALHLLSQVGKTGVLGPDTPIREVVLGGEAVNGAEVPICAGPLPQLVNNQLSRHTWQGFKSLSQYLSEAS